MNEAVEHLKIKAKATKIHLVGYSGGGAIAVLIAARRKDVLTLRTIAGDLDPPSLAEYHHTTPLQGSLNPTMAIPKILNLPQQHFSGGKDKTVPHPLLQSVVIALHKQGGQLAEILS